MAQWVKVGAAADVAPGCGRTLDAAGKQLAVFNLDGTYHAIDNTCLHLGGPLGEGALDGPVVTCPWHGWQYDVTTGKNIMSEVICVKKYPLERRGEELYVDLEA